MKVNIYGADNVGWSLDSDRERLLHSLQRMGINTSRSILFSDIIHSVSWNNLLYLNLSNIMIRIKHRGVLATTSNFINLDDPEYVLKKDFDRINKLVEAWIVPSTKQKDIFDKRNIRNYYLPFCIDLNKFTPLPRTGALYERLGIPLDKVKDRVILGSFQRDSLGADLSKPKWQKGPEILIDLIRDLPKDKYILLLAGPRRHYVIRECKKYGIPYIYLGKETDSEDIFINTIPLNNMPDLYRVTDIYLITSRSEGGPKAVMEAVATKTFIMSTDVGLAQDLIEQEFVYKNLEMYKSNLSKVVNKFTLITDKINVIIEKNFKRGNKLISENEMDKRLGEIYKDLCKRIRRN